MNLRHFRKLATLTQSNLANLMQVDQSTVSKWERNVASPNIETLKKIAEVLGCSVDELIKEEI